MDKAACVWPFIQFTSLTSVSWSSLMQWTSVHLVSCDAAPVSFQGTHPHAKGCHRECEAYDVRKCRGAAFSRSQSQNKESQVMYSCPSFAVCTVTLMKLHFPSVFSQYEEKRPTVLCIFHTNWNGVMKRETGSVMTRMRLNVSIAVSVSWREMLKQQYSMSYILKTVWKDTWKKKDG